MSVRIMKMRLTKLLGALVLAAASSGLATSAIAQTTPSSPVGVPASPRTLGVDESPYTEPGVSTEVAPADVPVSPRTLGIQAPYFGQPIAGEPNRLITLPEAFNILFFRESGDFYRNRSIPRQITFITGIGLPGRAGFPDLELERDALRITRLYRSALELQNSSDPVIRTPDLPNPFNTSVLQQPGARRLVGPREGFLSPAEGGEFNLEAPLPR